MKSNTTNSRRQFLMNTALAALTAGMIPTLSKSGKAQPANAANCNATTLDYYGQGPFYRANAPDITNGQLAAVSEAGTRLILSGIVKTLDCSEVIPNAKIDIWHANDAGAYDNTGFNLRGVTYSNQQGFYLFETILPGKYLNGSQYRPSHIHFKITPPGFSQLTTQLYFEGDTDIPADAAASITSGQFDATHRTIPITLNNDGKYEGTWDITLDGDGLAVGIQDIHLQTGMIYSAAPNPVTDRMVIRYGVFNPSKASIAIFNMSGQQVAVLDERHLSPEKYEAVWHPESSLPRGVYFVTLRINDMQVHYVKVMKA